MINQNKIKMSNFPAYKNASVSSQKNGHITSKKEIEKNSFVKTKKTNERSIIDDDVLKSAMVSSRRISDSEPKLRFVPLGGLEEIGRNMMFFEYKNEIIIIDVGLQFPEEETPGVDFIIPNISYLEPRKANIRAILLTHAHYDHIGAIPYLKRQGDFPNQPKLNITVVENHDKIKLSNYFEAEFFGIPHTIPDATGILLKTPVGNIANFIDFRVDYDIEGNPQHLDEFEVVGKQGILALLIDSTKNYLKKLKAELLLEFFLLSLIG
jgi:mRNA degradation ribonuclease J1/J2